MCLNYGYFYILWNMLIFKGVVGNTDNCTRYSLIRENINISKFVFKQDNGQTHGPNTSATKPLIYQLQFKQLSVQYRGLTTLNNLKPQMNSLKQHVNFKWDPGWFVPFWVIETGSVSQSRMVLIFYDRHLITFSKQAK